MSDREAISDLTPAELLRDIQWLKQEAERCGFTDAPPFGPAWLVKETAQQLIKDKQTVGISPRYLRAIERDLLEAGSLRQRLAAVEAGWREEADGHTKAADGELYGPPFTIARTTGLVLKQAADQLKAALENRE